MMTEIETQLNGKPPDLVVTPVGVGSFAQAVVSHSKAAGRNTRVLAVEPDTAACLWKSLNSGASLPINTNSTIMSGMNCGTVSTNAWPILKSGVDASVTVSDIESHLAVEELLSLGVNAGPCGGSTLAALRYATSEGLESLGLTKDSVVVLLSTEGARDYIKPLDVRISDPVELTQALVRIDSTNPDLSKAGGVGEKPIAEFITAWLEHRNIETHWLEETPGRPSIVAIVRGSGGGKSMMMNGHLDTVTTAGYKGDPLSGKIQDGSVYGRGTFDMKAGLAAALVALALAKEANLRGDVIFAGVADEENLSFGTEEVLRDGWRADGAIVMEPTFLDIVLAHKGFVWFEVDIIGRAAHGSRYDLGIDAISKAGYFLVQLDHYSQSILNGKGHPELGTGSVHASLIQGGEEPSSYPAKCTITIERRTVPGETRESTLEEIKSMLDKLVSTVADFQYEIRVGVSRIPFQISKDDPFVTCAIKGIETALERPGTFRPEKFWTDCALLAEKGISSLLFGVDGEGAHAATEWATVDSIRKVSKALTLVLEDFCR
jgi:acetylornithine deacetylase/succinyl-diaminopimelate desuccinylase-like protein